MGRCLISFGANIGDPLKTIRAAAEFLQPITSADASDFRLSRFFRTPPVGGPTGQPPFVNAVAAIETPLDVWEVWAAVRRAEAAFGRQRNIRWEARKLDLDILLHDDLRVWTPRLKVPHPRMCMRRFILAPAADVAADWMDPVSRFEVGELYRRLANGPGCLRILAADRKAGMRIAAEAASRAGASLRVVADPSLQTEPVDSSVQSAAAFGREIEVVPLAESPATRSTLGAPFAPFALGSENVHASKLTVFLTSKETREGAWEDIHREAAIGLGMKESNPPADWGIHGAKYLLAADDEEWAMHELTAALEAMDCPVEPILV